MQKLQCQLINYHPLSPLIMRLVIVLLVEVIVVVAAAVVVVVVEQMPGIVLVLALV